MLYYHKERIEVELLYCLDKNKEDMLKDKILSCLLCSKQDLLNLCYKMCN